MPRNNQQVRKKHDEKFLVKEAVRHFGYKISRAQWQERPDCLLTVSRGKDRSRIGIELTGYFNDVISGQSSEISRIVGFWKFVQDSLVRRISHRKHLSGLLGSVRFKDRFRPTKHNAKELAEELVEFAELHPVEAGAGFPILFRRHEFANRWQMSKHFDSVRLTRTTDESIRVSRFCWICSNIEAGHVAISSEYIKSALKDKNKRAVGYENWSDADEKWLLIVSGGGKVNTHAGPLEQTFDWNDPEITKLCDDSLFDRIVLFERVRHWSEMAKGWTANDHIKAKNEMSSEERHLAHRPNDALAAPRNLVVRAMNDVRSLAQPYEARVQRLRKAILQNDRFTAQLLLNADSNLVDSTSAGTGATPLHLATQKNCHDMVNLLITHGANIESCANGAATPLHWAARAGRPEVIILLLGYEAQIDSRDGTEQTPLHWAARWGQVRAAERLIDHGADVDATDSKGATPLHYAARWGHLPVTKLLLKSNAINGTITCFCMIEQDSCHSAQSWAIGWEHRQIAELLGDCSKISATSPTFSPSKNPSKPRETQKPVEDRGKFEQFLEQVTSARERANALGKTPKCCQWGELKRPRHSN